MNQYLPLTSPTRIAILATLLSSGVAGYAGASLVSQTRTIDASAKAVALPTVNGPITDSKAAPDFSPFIKAVEPFALAIGGPSFSVVQGVAKQNSVLSEFSFEAQGEASVSMTLTSSIASSGIASGDSFFEVFFSIDEPSRYAFSGFVDTQAILTGGAVEPFLDNEVALVRTDDNTLIFTSGSNDGTLLADGDLDPGNYRLWARAQVTASQGSSGLSARTVSGISEFEFRMLIAGIPETSTYLSAFGLLGLVAMAGYRRVRE